MKDLTGRKFGSLCVLKKTERKDSSRSYYYLCRCDCGKEKEVNERSLLYSNTVSCGCYQANRSREATTKNMLGLRFGRLVVIDRRESNNRRQAVWLCLCDCGRECVVTGFNLRQGKTNSCGCLNTDTRKARFYRHGLSRTLEYKRADANRRREDKTVWTLLMEIALSNYFDSCVLCKRTNKLETDHVYPLSKGHGLRPGNAVRLCRTCNSRKKDKLPEELSLDDQKTLLAAAESFRVAWSGGF